ncbi:membrane protein insertase YidC [Rufibacter glacialis]|uniref:Membrane protein insertase YidC n=1 Tax=Rufibacter glacialis TaxID=1259555 RepID=A0A5M8QES6_9BACT|nr:membrane protein insertase YidC [Rufibacter glacialis]KAA6434547.1 membrane protein insertase YidC [Rufibacter glacialis]GGK70546.1 membrane protein insertase YidC [Rufibacter glacialis]
MDKNSAIGMGLIAVIILVYSIFFMKEPVQQPVQKANKTTTAATKATPTTPDDSLANAQRVAQLGEFGALATGQNQTTVLENQVLRVSLGSQGGKVEEVELKNYKTWDKKPLILFDKETSQQEFSFQTKNGRSIRLSDLFFQPSEVKNLTVNKKPARSITYTAQVAPGQTIEQVYTLQDDSYEVGYALNFRGMEAVVAQQPVVLTWTDELKRLERDIKQNRNHSTVNYYTADGDFDYLSASSTDPESEKLEEPVKWVANKQNFFTAAIIAQNTFSDAQVSSSFTEADTSQVKNLKSRLSIPVSDALTGKAQFTYFFGPNDYDVLKNVTEGFDRNLELGWGIFAWVNKLLIIPAFDFLEDFVPSYGIIIILLVLYIKLILSPLTYKSYISMAKMKVLKPEIDVIKEKNEGDMQKTQAETMSLYSKMGVNPMSGCIPMLLQMPILFAMFNFFPNSIELRQEPFLWAHDLSTYDVFAMLPFTIPFYGNHVSMFTLLMTASTILYTWSNNQVSTIQGPMKFYSYLMPVIFMFVLNSFPAGLSFYYFVSNIVTFGQQALIRYFVDENKIRQNLEEYQEKNKGKEPKGGFQKRLQEAMKAAAEQEAKRKKGTK